jgi:hypothetical protein
MASRATMNALSSSMDSDDGPTAMCILRDTMNAAVPDAA